MQVPCVPCVWTRCAFTHTADSIQICPETILSSFICSLCNLISKGVWLLINYVFVKRETSHRDTDLGSERFSSSQQHRFCATFFFRCRLQPPGATTASLLHGPPSLQLRQRERCQCSNISAASDSNRQRAAREQKTVGAIKNMKRALCLC